MNLFLAGRGERRSKAQVERGARSLALFALGCRHILAAGRSRRPSRWRSGGWPNGSIIAEETTHKGHWSPQLSKRLKRSRGGLGQSANLPGSSQRESPPLRGDACVGSKLYRPPFERGPCSLAQCALGCKHILAIGRNRRPSLWRSGGWLNGSTIAEETARKGLWSPHVSRRLKRSRDGLGQSACLPGSSQRERARP